jgi:phage-related protein
MKSEPRIIKVIEWLGDSIDELRTWPKSVTEEAGTELLAVQKGRDPSNWKPMTTIGAGVREIRVAEEGNLYRVIYVAKFPEAVYVIHAFEKKTQRTSQHDLDLAKRRYKELLNMRRRVGR